MAPRARIFLDIECLIGFFCELVVKELAVTTENGVVQSWIFEPPCESRDLPKRVRKQNRWITSHLHRIRWNQGHVKYNQLERILRETIPKNATVYVKGLEKKELLQELLCGWREDIRIVDLADCGCPSVNAIEYSPTQKCAHKHRQRCALVKCLKYMEWFRQNESKQQQQW